MNDPIQPRRFIVGAARKFFEEHLDPSARDREPDPDGDVPRLTSHALEKISMSRSRERILANLDEMYREAFERAKTTGDQSQMATLDFAYRREQLYFEILLDVRDALERRG
jgi:hypothetical protein